MESSAAEERRILIFAEAVTLAHVARPLCFARGLDPGRYRVAIAAAAWVAPFIQAAGIEHLPLTSIEPSRFLEALARGSPVYDATTLGQYVEADCALIARYRPNLIVGDFRLSLSVSARLAQVPYVAISSAYWSPHYTPSQWPVPSLPISRYLPLGLAQTLFSIARPFAFAGHCGPMNVVRRHHGLPALPRDLQLVYTDADHVLYSDFPELFPMGSMPPTHRFGGAVLWEPANPLPDWWDRVPAMKPQVYVTLGSSGAASQLPMVVEAIAALPVSVLVATAGAPLPAVAAQNVFAAPYLPGLQAARRAQLVVCNGGSLTAYQALAGGAPVLGLAGNLDQFLNMQAFERAGLGRTLRADRLVVRTMQQVAKEMIALPPATAAMAVLQERCAAERFESAAAALVQELVG